MNIENGPPIQALLFKRGEYHNSPPILVCFIVSGGRYGISPCDSGPHIFKHVSGNRVGLRTENGLEIISGDKNCNIEIQYEP